MSKISRKTLERKIRKETGNPYLHIMGTSQKEIDRNPLTALNCGYVQYYLGSDTKRAYDQSFPSLSAMLEWFYLLCRVGSEEDWQKLVMFNRKAFLFTVSYSDGNDCSHEDWILLDLSMNSAFQKLWNHFTKKFPKWEEDCSDSPCLWQPHKCKCEDFCECNRESITIPLDAISEHDTEKEAENARATYHSFGGTL